MGKSHITYYDDTVQGSKEWLAGRENMFTGSNAYKLLTSFGAGDWAKAKPSSFTGNDATRRGHYLEEKAIELYEIIYNVKLMATGFVTNKKHKDCLYSPDAFTEKIIVEVKCFYPKKHLETIKFIETKIAAQCHFGQMVMEKNMTHLVLYCPRPKDWDDEVDGEFPVPLDKMFVVIPIKKDKLIQNNFQRKLAEYHGK